MTVTKMECPNCHGQLDIPEGMKEGFVSCKFCNTKVYIEPHKPNITQNFNIKEVNYNRPSAPVRSESKELNVVAIVIAIGILASTFLFAIILPLLRYRSYSTVISSESYRSAPEEEVMKSFSEVAFYSTLHLEGVRILPTDRINGALIIPIPWTNRERPFRLRPST